ncbi:MAG: response regulator transcription factor [Eubacteriales bacterium]
MGNGKILIVDDDKNICKLIEIYLNHEGYETVCCHDGSAALDIVKEGNYDLVLLDLMIPIINGSEVCRIIKAEMDIPIIMVTARDLVDDKVNGFNAGADDYIVKPFEPKELVARVKARLKPHSSTTEENTSGVLSIDNLWVNIDKYEVKINGELVSLKPKEIQLLHYLLANKNIVFNRDQLLQKVWDYAYSGETRTVDVHIKRLRDKLGNSSEKWELKTIWGVGYKFEVKE